MTDVNEKVYTTMSTKRFLFLISFGLWEVELPMAKESVCEKERDIVEVKPGGFDSFDFQLVDLVQSSTQIGISTKCPILIILLVKYKSCGGFGGKFGTHSLQLFG